MICLEGKCLSRLDQYGTVGPAGIEPAYAGLQPAAKSVSARDPWSRSEDSNPVCLVPGQARSPLRHIPVGTRGVEPRFS
jgi:hypothetical protein